jgi:hypothetical protein
MCGDGDHINIYTNGAYIEPSITAVSGFTYRGCREEPGEHRDLPDANFKQADMSPQMCAGLCAGYLYVRRRVLVRQHTARRQMSG